MAVVVQFVVFFVRLERQTQVYCTGTVYLLFLFGGITGLAEVERICRVVITTASKIGYQDWNLGSLFFELEKLRHLAVFFSEVPVEIVTIENPVLQSIIVRMHNYRSL